MADERVGGVYLEIGAEIARGTPDDAIKKIRASVKKAAEIKLPVGLDSLKKAAVSAARRDAQEVAKTLAEVQLPSGLKAPTKSAINAARRAAQELAKSVKPVELPTSLQNVTGKQLTEVRNLAQRMAQYATVNLPVDLDRSDGKYQASLQKIVDDVEDQEAELPVIPDVDSATASARMAWLTRPRTVSIIPELSKSAMAAVTGQLLALSGARAVTDRIRGLSTALQNLDRTIPAIAGVSTAILNIGSAGLAGAGNLLTLGGSLSSIAAVGLTLPGIFAGFGVGLGVTIAALADAGDILSDLGPQFSALQDTISDNFWAEFEAPIRNLVETWMPSLSQGFGEIATELGIFGASMSNALSSADNVSHLDNILGSVRDSIDIAGEGIAHFSDAMMGLVDVGASYLPALAGWFNRVSEDFSAWIEEATNSGEIFDWIDTGIQAMQDLGRVVWGLGGIFSNMATAASAAGGSTLGDLADGLENVNAAMEGPAFQGAMTTVFQGASDAMAALGPGVAALGDAFTKFAPTLAEIMVLAGEIGSVALAAIASAFENPAFQGGLVDFFNGVLSGVQAVAPHIPALAAAFGSVASFAGTLAGVLGPVLGAAIEALAPVVTSLMEGLSAIAPVLGEVLVSAIQTIAPFIQQVVGSIMEWVQQNPQLAATILAVIGGIGLLVTGAMTLIGALAPILGTVISVATAIAGAGGLSAAFAAVSAAVSAFMAAAAPVLAVIAGIVVVVGALVAALIYAWQSSEQFRAAVVGLFTALWEAAQPVIAFITGTVVPVVMQVVSSIVSGVQMIMDALIPMWTVMLQIWTEIIQIMTPVIAFIMSIFAPIFTYLGTVVSAAFTLISTIISNVINIVTAILQVFLAVLQGDWSAAWAAVKNVVAVVWQAIQNVVGAGITYARTVIGAGLNMIRSLWTTIWGAISSFVSSVLSRIVSFVVNGISRARSTVSNGLNAIRTIWTTVWNAVSSFVSSALARIVSAVVSGISSARSTVQSGLSAIRSFFTSVWNAIVSVVTSVFGRIVSTISSGISRARSAVTSGMNAVRSIFQRVLAAVISAVTGAIGRVVSAFRNMMSRAKSTIQGFVGQFRSVGGNIISGLVSGIKGAAGKAVSAAKGVVGDALNGAKALLGINSPSKAFAEVGMWSGEGFVQGIDDMARKAQKAAKDMVEVPSPARVTLPTGSASPLLSDPRLAPVEPSAAARADGAGVHLSDETILRLAQTMANLPVTLKVGHRQAGTLTMAGQQSTTMMGGNRL